jgi:hypothetical protein
VIVILTEFMDFVMVAKVAMVAIFPNIASVDVEKRMVTAAIRELDTGKGAGCPGGLRLENWLQDEHRKKQGDQREDRFCVKVNAHVATSNFISAIWRDGSGSAV